MKGQNFASQVLSRHTFRISRKKGSDFFDHRGTLRNAGKEFSSEHFDRDLFLADLHTVPFNVMDVFEHVDDKLFAFETLFTEVLDERPAKAISRAWQSGTLHDRRMVKSNTL